MSYRIVLMLAAFGAAGCQTYEFAPVSPLAVAQTVKPVNIVSKEAKPNLFLVVDKSGSMDFSADSNPSCTSSCGSQACNNNGCTTRMKALQDSMNLFLTTSGGVAHMGMVPYPNIMTGGNRCGVDPATNNSATINDVATLGVELDVGGSDDDAALQANASAINAKIQAPSFKPEGGTPTGATLRALKDYQPLLNKGRANYILLLTDGLPNCNQSIPTTCAVCTLSTPANPCTAPSGGVQLNQCLDKDGTVAEINSLRTSAIKTIVVGFGAELASGSGVAVDALTAMGAAGGFQRPCTTDAQCGAGDTCSVTATDPCGKQARVCARTFFTAQNATELTTALNTIRDSIRCSDPCTQYLSSRPTGDREALVSVIVDGKNVQPSANTWRYDPAGPSIVFPQGTQICNDMLNATTANPVKLEIRFVEAL